MKLIDRVVENVFKIMSEKGIKQRNLADAMNVDESQISVLKRGNRDLRVSEIENIASCLGVSVTDLFTWPDHFILDSNGHSAKTQNAKVILQLELEDNNLKADVIKLAFGERVLEIKNG